MAFEAGGAFVELGVDMTRLTKGFAQGERATNDFAEHIETRVEQTEGSFSKIGSAAGAMLGGLALGGAVALGGALVGVGVSAFNMASDVKGGTNQIQAALGTTAEEAEALQDVATNIFGNNWGSSMADASQAVIDVRTQMKGLSDTELQAVTEGALTIRDVFGVEVAESTNAANTLMQQFGLTSQQATDFLAAGMQGGLNASGDFLETIGEYSTQFAAGGATADQFFSLLDSGMQGGVLGTDKAADAFKEFRVRIQDGSTATADSLALLGINSDELAAKMASGQITAADAFQLVQDKLRATTDQNVLMQAGVGLLGTQFEDLGTKGATGLSLVGTSLADMAGATDGLNAKYNDLGSLMGGLWRGVQVDLLPVGTLLLDLANNAMPAVQSGFAWFGEVLPGVITSVVGGFSAISTAILTVVTPLQTAYAAFQTWQAFTGTLGGIQAAIQSLGTSFPLLQPITTWFSATLPVAVGMATTAINLVRDGVLTFIAAYNGDWQNSDKILLLHQVFGTLGSIIGGTVVPAIQSMVGWFQQNQDLVTKVGVAVGVAVAVFQTLSTVVAVVGTVTAAIAGMGAGMTAAGGIAATIIAVLGGPLTIALGVVALAAGALALAWQTNFGGIQEKTAAVSGWFTGTAVPAMDAGNKAMATQASVMRAAWDRDWAALQTKVGAVQSWWSGTAVPAISAGLVVAVTKVGEMRTAWDTAFEAVRTAISTMSTAWNTAVAGIGVAIAVAIGHVTTFRDTVSTKITEAVAFFSGLPGRITGAIGDLSGILTGAGRAVIGGLLTGISSAWESGKAVLTNITNAIPKLKGPPAEDAKLLFENGRLIIDGLIKGFGSMEPKLVARLTGITDLIGKTFSVIGSGVDALAKLSNAGATNVTGLQIQGFLGQVSLFLMQLEEASEGFSAKGLAHAATFAESAGKIVGLIGPAVDGLAKIAAAKATQITGPQVQQFLGQTLLFVIQLHEATEDLAITGYEAAAKFAQAFGGIMGLIGPAVDSLTKFASFKATQITGPQFQQFLGQISTWVVQFQEATEDLAIEGYTTAAEFAQAFSGIMGLIGPSVDALTKFAGMKATQITGPQFQQFLGQVFVWITQMTEMAEDMAIEGVEAAAVFATAAGKIIAPIAAAVDAFTKLKDYTGAATGAIDVLGQDILLTVDKMVDMASKWSTDGVEAAAVFGTAVGKIVSPISAAIDAFTKLQKYEGIAPGMLDWLGADIRAAVDKMVDIAQYADQAGVDAAATFAGASGKIFGGMKSGLDALAALGKYEGLDPAKIGQFTTDIGAVLTAATGQAQTQGEVTGFAFVDAWWQKMLEVEPEFQSNIRAFLVRVDSEVIRPWLTIMGDVFDIDGRMWGTRLGDGLGSQLGGIATQAHAGGQAIAASLLAGYGQPVLPAPMMTGVDLGGGSSGGTSTTNTSNTNYNSFQFPPGTPREHADTLVDLMRSQGLA